MNENFKSIKEKVKNAGPQIETFTLALMMVLIVALYVSTALKFEDLFQKVLIHLNILIFVTTYINWHTLTDIKQLLKEIKEKEKIGKE